MALQRFTDNANTTLAAGISAVATSLSVTSGTGSLFPALTANQWFIATLVKANTPTVFEIIRVNARAGDTFTSILRAQEGTAALAWSAGDEVALLLTAGGELNFAQIDDLQTQETNFALDVGSSNAKSVNLTPALLAHQEGLPIRWISNLTNTGACTFNDGVGAAPLLTSEGVALVAGQTAAGGMYECYWNGSAFFMSGVHNLTFAQISGQVSAAQVPQAAVTQYTAAILASAALTGVPTTPTAAPGTSTTQVASTAFVNRGSSLATDGYRKNPDNSITQWGQILYSGSGSTLDLTFPTPFTSECFSVVFTPQVGGYSPGVETLSASGVVMSMNNLGGTEQIFYWQAEGV